ncbi:MAG: Asp-tRNA(Asn)/Glu-tRNA(Gln) amidotransferase subunit GatB [Dehalococcoidia bacterium]|nr:Asp-tRNA(Asn)/Glu-tRNA(Gln) amidotransferase subunit GatB [Dehalococcoidia bacterium]
MPPFLYSKGVLRAVEDDVTTVATEFETVIGLEVHCQLTTQSKMFCGCSVAYAGAAPNTHVCPVCLGLPGVLPVINEQAIAAIVRTGLALNCEIASFSKFDRKNYPYPDLMKGYQISQYDLPVCRGGWLDIQVEGQAARRVGITRVHMEEDTARLLHRTDPATGQGYSLVDVNRSGTPLMEIVSEPDLRTPAEAREYLVRLRQILRYIGVSEANMEDGNFRCDANVSLRPRGASTLGTKVEIKNMNSFRAVHDALAFEERRQAALLEAGERVAQETRGWVDERSVTVSQRSKEEANDYRYFPEPDLPPLQLSREWVESVRADLPELPEATRQRFLALGLSDDEARTLAETRERAAYFEAVAAKLALPAQRAAKLAANWVLGEALRWCNANARDADRLPVTPERLAELIGLVEGGTITAAVAKGVFEKMVASGATAAAVVEQDGLAQISGTSELRTIVRKAIEDNPHAVADYRAGKQAAVKFLIGQVMRETRGRANPAAVQTILTEELT